MYAFTSHRKCDGICGIIVDQQGVAIPGVTVTILKDATTIATSATADIVRDACFQLLRCYKVQPYDSSAMQTKGAIIASE